jgi:hypothetical protein
MSHSFVFGLAEPNLLDPASDSYLDSKDCCPCYLFCCALEVDFEGLEAGTEGRW